MAKKVDAKTIDRNLCASFSARSVEDRKLKAELQRQLDEGHFDSVSDFAKDLLRKGLRAADTDDDDALPDELGVTLRTIQQQLSELRESERKFESLLDKVTDIDGRTRTLRPAFAAGVAMLLVQMADWEESEAAEWANSNLLDRYQEPIREPPEPEDS